jgi:hypothetical protein
MVARGEAPGLCFWLPIFCFMVADVMNSNLNSVNFMLGSWIKVEKRWPARFESMNQKNDGRFIQNCKVNKIE